MKHTPGPWNVSTFTVNRQTERVIRGSDMHLATMARASYSEANARLIAAAPELLASLMFLVAEPVRYNGKTIEIDCDDHSDAMEIIKVARAAIVKATQS